MLRKYWEIVLDRKYFLTYKVMLIIILFNNTI